MSRIHTLPAGKIVVEDDDLKRVVADVRRNRNARVRVGILGAKASRSFDIARTKVNGKTVKTKEKATLNNAEIGAIHEFGSMKRQIPRRSFLRMPIIERLPGALKSQDRERWIRLFVRKGMIAWLEVLGALSLAIVQSAFKTGGFGKWPALSKRTVKAKGSSAILIDTAQLRQSITAEVVRKEIQ